MSVNISGMDEKVLKAFVTACPASWSDMKQFAADGFYQESGLDVEYLKPMTSDGAAKLRKLFEVLEETYGTPRGDRIGDYLTLYAGAQYLESISYPFPKPSLLQSALPLTKGIEVGEVIMPIKGAIMKLNLLDAAPDDSEFITRHYSLGAVEEHAARLKEVLPETRTAFVMGFLSLTGSLRPELSRQAAAVFDKAFGEKVPFSGFSLEGGADPVVH